MKLIVGLGNPGPRYAATRHNVGFRIVEMLASRAGIALKRQGHQGLYGVGRVSGQETALLQPQTFMNLSGASVASACKSLGVSPGDLIVIHDDLDLPFGTLRLRVGGGHGGHNGLRSIAEVLGSKDFIRIKFGIGRPPQGADVADYVLTTFSSAERPQLDDLFATAATAAETILGDGVARAMNRFNTAV